MKAEYGSVHRNDVIRVDALSAWLPAWLSASLYVVSLLLCTRPTLKTVRWTLQNVKQPTPPTPPQYSQPQLSLPLPTSTIKPLHTNTTPPPSLPTITTTITTSYHYHYLLYRYNPPQLTL